MRRKVTLHDSHGVENGIENGLSFNYNYNYFAFFQVSLGSEFIID